MSVSRILQVILALTLLATALALVGCPKKPNPSPAGSASAPSPAVSGGAGGAGLQPGGGVASSLRSGATTPPAVTGGSGSGGPRVAPGAGAGAGALGAAGTVAPALPSPKAYAENPALTEIHFDFDRYEIRVQDRTLLEQNAQWLKARAGALVLIEGHADERGTNEYNLALGERRAKAVRDYLATLGVDGARVTIISYGEERPFCIERAEPCWARNRRAHFLVK